MPADPVESQPRPGGIELEDSPMQQEDEQHQGQHEQDGTAPPQIVLTPLLLAGTEGLRSRTAEIYAQLDELEQAGVDFIEHLKQAFVKKMQEARVQIQVFADNTSQDWIRQSEATISLDERLQTAQRLVTSLEAGFGRA